jgi:hypothetical protein
MMQERTGGMRTGVEILELMRQGEIKINLSDKLNTKSYTLKLFFP